MRSWRAQHNLLAVSANSKETAINTEQTLDTSLLVSMTDVINLEPKRETNADELTGHEEPDTVYDLGALSNVVLNFEKAQPQHFGFLLAYALGAISTGAAGAGYQHAITPIANDEDVSRSNPSFTAIMRWGSTVLKRRFASMFVDAITATFARDAWVKIAGTIKGTGKVTDNITEESVVAARNLASLTLAANAVEGATAGARLDNVQRIRVQLSTGVWTEVVYSAVSDATPAVITQTAPCVPAQIAGLSQAAACVVTWVGHGMASLDEVDIADITQADWSALNATHVITVIDVDSFSIPVNTSAYGAPYDPGTDPGTIVNSTDATFKVLYIPDEAAWCTFPARVTETPLRVTAITALLGGKYTAAGGFVGGREFACEIESIEYNLQNNLQLEMCVGGSGSYADRCFRDGRVQTLKVNREFRDYILQQHIDDNDTFAVQILAEGAVFDSPHMYTVGLYFPKVAVLSAPLSVNGKRLAEAGDLIVLEDSTEGSVRAIVKNLVATYAA